MKKIIVCLIKAGYTQIQIPINSAAPVKMLYSGNRENAKRIAARELLKREIAKPGAIEWEG